MQPCKRIEIVIEEPLLRRMLAALEEIGVPGYTVIRGVSGRGDRGERRGDDVTSVFTNCLVLVACDAELATQVANVVRPVLSASGGVCIVSDAQWLRH